MVELITFIMLSWTIFITSAAFANGSSGVGTASIPITDGIEASSLNGQVKRADAHIVASGAGRPLIALSDLDPTQVADLQAKNQVVPARLGTVDGFEFTPDQNDRDAVNYWIVCGNTACKKLEPLANDALIPEIIGTLSKK